MSDDESIWSPVERDQPASTSTTSEAPSAPSDPPGLRPAWILVGALLLVLGLGLVVASLLGRDDTAPPEADEAQTAFAGPATGGGSESPASGGTPTAGSTETDGGGWPSDTIGRPVALGTNDAQPSGEPVELTPGIYVWGDFDGWHVWAVRAPGAAPIEGLVTSTDEMARANLEGPSEGNLDLDGEKFSFELGTSDRTVDGISFNPGFFVTDIIVQSDDPSIPIFTGFEAVPAANPLLVRRTA